MQKTPSHSVKKEVGRQDTLNGQHAIDDDQSVIANEDAQSYAGQAPEKEHHKPCTREMTTPSSFKSDELEEKDRGTYNGRKPHLAMIKGKDSLANNGYLESSFRRTSLRKLNKRVVDEIGNSGREEPFDDFRFRRQVSRQIPGDEEQSAKNLKEECTCNAQPHSP
ncbi:hypothetical protein FBEOM_10010 [Fusarium beomiforme]|uniref:Uncharacterized protein n=1 Tax=Fusarium beomiforme TaxID=44412 RepID=A0A9P5AC68_9HYPO|nr:hypothetical protein FBEOM_10010 [Fusarium beomiforme]